MDLSEAIILEAQKVRPNLYDEVRVGDVTEVFRAEAPISMIVAADSYIYFGDLDPLFQSMEDSLEEGGYVACTLENVSEESEERYVPANAKHRQLVYCKKLTKSDGPLFPSISQPDRIQAGLEMAANAFWSFCAQKRVCSPDCREIQSTVEALRALEWFSL